MNDIETELGRVLHERALLVETAPDYAVEPEPQTSPVRVLRPRPNRRPRSGLASAAAVAALAAGLAAAVWSGAGHPHRSDRATPAVTECSARGAARLDAAVRRGSLAAGAEVLSGTAQGMALVAVNRGDATAAVDVVTADGQSTRIWTAGPNDHVRVVANPSGAVNADWVVFVLAAVHGGGASRIALVERATGQLTEVATDPGYGISADPLLAPVLGDDAITFVETSLTQRGSQRTVYHVAHTGTTRPTYSIPTSDVTSLLPVGGNIVSVRTGPAGDTRVDFDQPANRPATLLPAVRDGYGFTSDGTTMRWLVRTDARYELWQWAPGDAAPIGRILTMTVRPTTPAGPLATGGRQVDDPATGRVLDLPYGLSLLRVDGTVATVAAGAHNSRIPTAALADC